MSWKGEKRRSESQFCESHGRSLDDIDQLKTTTGRLSGWQKAQAFFIALCFGCVVMYASETSKSVAQVNLSVAKIDKQVAMLITSNAQHNHSQDKLNDKLVMDVERNKEAVGRLEANCLIVSKHLGL